MEPRAGPWECAIVVTRQICYILLGRPARPAVKESDYPSRRCSGHQYDLSECVPNPGSCLEARLDDWISVVTNCPGQLCTMIMPTGLAQSFGNARKGQPGTAEGPGSTVANDDDVNHPRFFGEARSYASRFPTTFYRLPRPTVIISQVPAQYKVAGTRCSHGRVECAPAMTTQRQL